MIKVYICASFPRRKEAQALALKLSSIMEIVSTWHRDDLVAVPRTSDVCCYRVMRDIKQIRDSDLVIVIIGDKLSGGGRHTEFGIAFGMQKDIILAGKYDSNPFELIPYLRIYDTIDKLIEEFFKRYENMNSNYKWKKTQAKLNTQNQETEELGG